MCAHSVYSHLFIESRRVLQLRGVASCRGDTLVREGSSTPKSSLEPRPSEATPTLSYDDTTATGHELNVMADTERLKKLSRAEGEREGGTKGERGGETYRGRKREREREKEKERGKGEGETEKGQEKNGYSLANIYTVFMLIERMIQLPHLYSIRTEATVCNYFL